MCNRVIADYSDVIAFKAAASEKFSDVIHFHDGCGGQYFSLEHPASEEFKNFVKQYFECRGISAVFSEDGENFTIKEL